MLYLSACYLLSREFSVKRFSLLPVVVGVLLSACTVKPITQDSIREAPAHKISFSVDRPYQQVFADVLDNTRNCFSRQPTQDQLFVTGKKDNGKKTANIRVELVYAKKSHDVHFMVDLVSDSANKTTVTAYTSDNDAKGNVDAVKLWAANKSKACVV